MTRGKSLPAARQQAAASEGVGWVPANLSLDPFGGIAPNPWGPTGEIRLRPDPAALLAIERPDGPSPFQLALADAYLDGEPWDACPRGLLKRTLAEVERVTGCGVLSAFEHEFQLDPGAAGAHQDAFSPHALAAAEPFPSTLVGVLAAAGFAPEMVFSEFGPRQFEVPCGPAPAHEGADRALLLRETVREVARWSGRRASFTPIAPGAGVGNGVHIHLSLRGEGGFSPLGALDEEGGAGDLGRSFAAGIVAHGEALCALTAPSPVSYERLGPGHWSAGYAALGGVNREVLLRIVGPGTSSAHVEFRAADATANPYLALGAILAAGLDGVRRNLPPAARQDEDPATLDPAERERRGIRPLPASLEDALAALAEDEALSGWLPPELRDAYLAMKRHELDLAAELGSPAEIGEAYGRIY
ncbi:MAG: glutamine synthetase [Actinobacteria bacterium]|nr:glutamine synthetase [Actinomycetota bacterium]